MTKSQAKRLKAGDRVLWHGNGNSGVGGTVTRKRYNTVWIQWDDALTERAHYADMMECVWTAEQLDALEEQQRVVEKIKEINREGLKKPFKEGS